VEALSARHKIKERGSDRNKRRRASRHREFAGRAPRERGVTLQKGQTLKAVYVKTAGWDKEFHLQNKSVNQRKKKSTGAVSPFLKRGKGGLVS